nr:MAG TPA: hypothetical protein [Caudoviricetes sp.]
MRAAARRSTRAGASRRPADRCRTTSSCKRGNGSTSSRAKCPVRVWTMRRISG